jgi:hypothetical protein
MGGIRYQNILMLVHVDDWGAVTPRGQARCQASVDWTVRVLSALYARATSHRAIPVPPAAPTPQLTPAAHPLQEYAAVAAAEQFVAGQLSSVSNMSQLRDQGLLPSSAFVSTALEQRSSNQELTWQGQTQGVGWRKSCV